MNETLLVLVSIVIYIILLSLCVIKSNDSNKKNIKMILVISTIVFIIGIILYANAITPHEWVKDMNTPSDYWESDPRMKEYIESNKVLIIFRYYGGILLIILSYIGNIIAIVKNNKKTPKDKAKKIDAKGIM